MDRIVVAATLAFGALPAPLHAADPLRPGYVEGEWLRPFFREYRVTGPGVDRPGEGSLLVCTYSTRPVVMVYTRALNGPVVRLVKKLDEATAARQAERLGSYLVLICDTRDREKDLRALAEREKIRHTLLSLVAVSEARPHRPFQDRFGPEAETTVVLATGRRRVKASHAYRNGELTDGGIERILADLSRILPKK
jgi:hypothetical protein